MKAILDMTRIPQLPSSEHSMGLPCFLYPIMGKPFLQHTVEYIEQLGIDELYVYLYDYAQEVENLIGDGERWGLSVTYFLIQKQTDLLGRVSVADYAADDELVLFGNGLVLPMIGKEHLGTDDICGFADEDDRCLPWAFVRKGAVKDFDTASNCPASPLENQVKLPYLSVRSGKEYLESMKTVMDKKFIGLISLGHEVREGLWIGPGVRIPKSTTLVPPVYIHEQTRVGENMSIGPYVEIGKGCVIDDESFITESVICDYGYTGKHLDIKRSVINKRDIFNCDMNTLYQATDEIFLSQIDQTAKTSVPVVSRIVALLLYIICLPIHIVLTFAHLIKHGRGFKVLDVVRLPQQVRSDQAYQTMKIRSYKNRRELEGPLVKHLLFVLIPGLGSVVSGKMRFCGLQPRTIEEVSGMNEEWKELYLCSSLGLISESEIIYKTKPEEEMLYASDIFYSVNDSFSYNVKLVRRYITGLFSGRNRM